MLNFRHVQLFSYTNQFVAIVRALFFLSLSISLSFLFVHAQRETNINASRMKNRAAHQFLWPIETYPSDQSLHGDAKEAICTLLYDPINFYYHPAFSVLIISSVFDANPTRYKRIYRVSKRRTSSIRRIKRISLPRLFF